MKFANLDRFLRERLLLSPIVMTLSFVGLKAVYCILIYNAITTPENMSRSGSLGWNFAWGFADLTFDFVFIVFYLYLILLKQAKIRSNASGVLFGVFVLFALFFIYLFVNSSGVDKKDLLAMFCFALQAFLWIYLIASSLYLKKKLGAIYPIVYAVLFYASYFASFAISLQIGSIFFTFLFPILWFFYFKYKFSNLPVENIKF
ncbi:hypothetical protein [Campylobacter sp.]|uniref:hypothetical protein n=1 Tax=Campylobacter sp. TaxID=205 RepID=UPI002709653C|nr:hypothetical protein [Campylobacter sp.]